MEAFYARLPIPIQHAACSYLGWVLRRQRFGGTFAAVLLEAERRTFVSASAACEYRDKRLREFVRHAAESVPFYRDTFASLGLRPEDIRGLHDLQQLPVLTKAYVQTQTRAFISSAVPQGKQIVTHTSGTTGAGLRFHTALSAIREQWAIWWRYRRWHGIEPKTWSAHFGGRLVVPVSQQDPPFWRYNCPGHQVLFSAHHMSPLNLGAYVVEIRRRRPHWLHGYPSLLALLASYIVETGETLDYGIRWITTGAENLLVTQADVIERAFGRRPIQHYGLAEAVANISECERGILHVDEDFAAVEFVPTGDGNTYRVVGTNVSNPATPLLRYDTGDLVTLSNEECGCGRPGRIVSAINGRQEDYIVLSNGACLGRLDHIFKDLTNIREAQLYQRQLGAITVRVVKGPRFSDDDELALLRQLRQRIGKDDDVQIEYRDYLERSKRGKLRFVVSDLRAGQLAATTPRTN